MTMVMEDLNIERMADSEKISYWVGLHFQEQKELWQRLTESTKQYLYKNLRPKERTALMVGVMDKAEFHRRIHEDYCR